MRIRGERIEELRSRLGWTQEKLAEESGVARDTISKLEAGVRNRSHGVTLGKITRTLGVDPMALSHEPCAVANGPAEAVGREVSAGRKCAAEGSEGRVPLASLEGEEAKRVLLRDVCEALDGPELTLLLQIAGRMLSGKLALAAAEGRVGGDTERVNTGRGDDPTLSPTDESPG